MKRSAPRRTLVIGTRGSPLARWQAGLVRRSLGSLGPGVRCVIRIIRTAGDRDSRRPLADIGPTGVFTSELEAALVARKIDLAVHSLKDLPVDLPAGLSIRAILKRADPRDCLVSRTGSKLGRLPRGARVGTSSPRRTAQLLALRPDLRVLPLRGNVDTRLKKARGGDYDAVVLAAAGIIRLGRRHEITEILPTEILLPDPGQGAIAVETRTDDVLVTELAARLDHHPTRLAVTAERSFLRELGGGCRVPVGAHAVIRGGALVLRGVVATPDGRRLHRGRISGPPRLAARLGAELARRMLGRGARLAGRIPRRPAAVPARLPLKGRAIVITRARRQAGEISAGIRALGGRPVLFPVIDFAPPRNLPRLDRALSRIGDQDWIVFPSANAVGFTVERLRSLGAGIRALRGIRTAVVGPATERALRDAGIRANFFPARFEGRRIASELRVRAGDHVLVLRADIATPELARRIAARGAVVTDVVAYRTLTPRRPAPDLSLVDAVTFASPSAVAGFLAGLDRRNRAVLPRLRVFCIGPTTARAAREAGLKVASTARVFTAAGLLSAIAVYYKDEAKRAGR